MSLIALIQFLLITRVGFLRPLGEPSSHTLMPHGLHGTPTSEEPYGEKFYSEDSLTILAPLRDLSAWYVVITDLTIRTDVASLIPNVV